MYKFIDENGTFELKDAEKNSYLYFPICNDAGIMGSLTPTLGGDLMLDKNRFILEPTGVENLHNNRNSRNFWLKFEDGALRSATGNSVWQKAEIPGVGTVLRAGLLWHEVTNVIKYKEESLKVSIMDFAPAEDVKCEIMRVSVTNTGNKETGFEALAVENLYARSADNLRDHRHVTSLLHRIKTHEYGVTVKPTLSFDERGHLKNTTVYYVAGCEENGAAPERFYPTVMSVIGEGGDFERPFGLMKADGGVGAGESIEGVEAAGGLKFGKCRLAPGEKKEYIVFTGAETEAGDEESLFTQLIKAYGSSTLVEEALARNKAHWLKLAKAGLKGCDAVCENIGKAAGLSTSDARNYFLWVAAEPVLRRIFGCSFLPYHDYGKGGRGWRDLWQDCLALMLGDPSSVRDLLINNFAGVRADGTNATIIGKEPGEFIADRNGIARVWMDHGVWTWITMKLYVRLSGDEAILDTEQVYFKDRLAMRARGIDEEADSELSSEGRAATLLKDVKGKVYSGSLLEHMLIMHLTVACDVGEHGNMLLRGADWNDALDMADKRGESVAFTAAYVGNFREMADSLRKRGGRIRILKEVGELSEKLAAVCEEELLGVRDISAGVCGKHSILEEYCGKVKHCVSGIKTEIDAAEMADRLDIIAWAFTRHIREQEFIEADGFRWMNGYYDNEGKPAESIEDGRIMLTGAVFAIMSGVADRDDAEKMIKTADEFLFDGKSGGYRLNTRFAVEEYYARNLGRMFGFAYGSKENGAVFCHMAVMYAWALLSRGFEKEALKAVANLVKQSFDFEKSRVYPGIPEYFDINGRGMYPYLTGAASWMLLFLHSGATGTEIK
ncbi:MAG: cellobiose phosphorylase [Lachnospiraceae bacterium]|nr:cellobiose phosphorylase [Lachnospiraceae bacterium]